MHACANVDLQVLTHNLIVNIGLILRTTPAFFSTFLSIYMIVQTMVPTPVENSRYFMSYDLLLCYVLITAIKMGA